MTDYARPETMEQVLGLLDRGAFRVLAGGTDVYPAVFGGLSGPVLDLTGIADLAGLSRDGDLQIGAATTWTAIAAADLPPGLRALQQAARQIGGRQIQNAGTIGGNLCNASPAADGVPPLLVADALVDLIGADGPRRLPLADFLQGPRRTVLRPGEVLAAVVIPKGGEAGRSAFVKLGARSHLVISIAMVAARLVVTAGRVQSAQIAVGACSPVAVRLPLVEAALRDAPVTDAVARIRAVDVQAALSPIDDVRATAAYRREAAVELVRRAVAEVLG